MATHGFVHSACAFQRYALQIVDKARITVFSNKVTRSTSTHLVTFLAVSGSQPGARSMASSSPIADMSGIRHRTKSSYLEAIVVLNSLQSNAETIRKSLQFRSETRKLNIPHMIDYLHRIGLTVDDVDKLSVIHVTGTKGKGSTCAFAESILRQYGYKTGLFSSPHLIEARERIRINGRPIDRDLFSSSFWEVYDKLQSTKDSSDGGMPHYFSFLTVMALHVFVREQVDVTLLEVGIGGQYDSTNVVSAPIACGVSSLDLDHTNLLGNTLEDIAWHKAGIFKKGAPAITVPQPLCAMEVLLNRTRERQCPLYIATPLKPEDLSVNKHVQLGIAGQKQFYNAALAVQLCQIWLRAHGRVCPDDKEEMENCSDIKSVEDIPVKNDTHLSQQMVTGLCECHWPGRTQTIYAKGVTYYLDGAHTPDSIQQCIEWFQEAAEKEQKHLRGNVWRALLFNMTGDRPVSALLSMLKECDFHRAAFCPNVVSTTESENIPDQLNYTVEQDTVLKKCVLNRQAWDQLFTDNDSSEDVGDNDSVPADSQRSDSGPATKSADFPCIASALRWAVKRTDVALAFPPAAAAATGGYGSERLEDSEEHVQVLITGSLHLVGGVLELITPHMND